MNALTGNKAGPVDINALTGNVQNHAGRSTPISCQFSDAK
jgi:hypothetical protein